MPEQPQGDVVLCYITGPEVSTSFDWSKDQFFRHDMVTNARLGNFVTSYCSSGGIAQGRNKLAEGFLETKGTWMFMVDTDMGFEPNILDTLLSVADPVARPIVGGLCFANRQIAADGMGGWITRAFPTILNWTKCEDGFNRFVGQSHFPTNAVITAGATGAAMLLIHRSVLERIFEEVGPNWFTQIPGEDGILHSEDVSFFEHCRRLEIPLSIHTGARTSHAKTSWVNEMDFWEAETPPPATDRCAVIVPVLHRPQNIGPLVDSLRASTGLATAYFVVEDGDHEIANLVLANGARVLFKSGTFAEKSNYAIDKTDEPWLLFVGDDVHFHAGWLDAALDIANRYGKSVIATNDCHNPRVTRGEHATHPLIERRYIDDQGASFDGPGTVAHEGYGHCYVDDEWTLKAKVDQVFAAALHSRVEHLHPFWTGQDTDDVYEKGQSTFNADQALFIERAQRFLGSRQ